MVKFLLFLSSNWQKGGFQTDRQQVAYKGLAGRCTVTGRIGPCRQIGRKWHIRGLLVDVLSLVEEGLADR